MDYKHRNDVLWRWCFFTFAVSLIISLVLTWVKPWGWTVPIGHIWVVPQIIPVWLAWPITNTLFVLTYVWIKTNHINLKPFWREHRFTSYLRAILHGLFVSLFCQFYSLPALIISSVILSVIIYAKFGDEFYNIHTSEQTGSIYDDYDNGDGIDDWLLEDVPPYGIASMLLFFYTVIAIYGLNKFGPTYDAIEIAATFIGVPILYAIASLLILAALALLVVAGLLLWASLERVNDFIREALGALWVTIKFFAEVFGEALKWIFLGTGFTVMIIAWIIYAACIGIANIFRWLFPPRPATAN